MTFIGAPQPMEGLRRLQRVAPRALTVCVEAVTSAEVVYTPVGLARALGFEARVPSSRI